MSFFAEKKFYSVVFPVWLLSRVLRLLFEHLTHTDHRKELFEFFIAIIWKIRYTKIFSIIFLIESIEKITFHFTLINLMTLMLMVFGVQ